MLGIVVIAILVCLFFYYENNAIDITKVNIKKNIDRKIRIVQLSDLHSKEFGKNNVRLFENVINEKPDLIVATGDLIDSNMKKIGNIIDFLVKLNERIPVVYIPGNNEIRCEKLNYILEELKKRGVIVLTNEITSIHINGNKINILGMAESRIDEGELFYQKANSKYLNDNYKELFKVFEKKQGLKIVLSHYPENFEAIGENSYSKYNFDIMFSGHAHGGQFILPFIGGVFAPGQGLRPKYYNGVYGGKKKLIVSRGLGNSGFPIRLFNRPNIIVIDIFNR